MEFLFKQTPCNPGLFFLSHNLVKNVSKLELTVNTSPVFHSLWWLRGEFRERPCAKLVVMFWSCCWYNKTVPVSLVSYFLCPAAKSVRLRPERQLKLWHCAIHSMLAVHLTDGAIEILTLKCVSVCMCVHRVSMWLPRDSAGSMWCLRTVPVPSGCQRSWMWPLPTRIPLLPQLSRSKLEILLLN